MRDRPGCGKMIDLPFCQKKRKKGSGIMVSDFIEECGGYLKVT